MFSYSNKIFIDELSKSTIKPLIFHIIDSFFEHRAPLYLSVVFIVSDLFDIGA